MDMYLPFFLSFGISIAVTPIVIKIAKKYDISDKPDHDRKIHDDNIPLLGGLAIYLGFIIPFLFFSKIDLSVIAFIITSAAILITGILDDIYNIPAQTRLLIEVSCAIYMACVGMRVDIGQYIFKSNVLIYLLDFILTVFWIIGVINAVNLVDGVDGLAGGVVAIAALGFAIIGSVIYKDIMFIMALSLIGAVIGFLIYNRNPAKIFMGDAGSTFLGYVLSILSIMSIDLSINKASLFVPVIILTVPIFDTGCAILRRIFSKKSVLVADRGHIHHRLLNLGYSQKKTVYIIYAIAIVSLIVGLIVYMGEYFMAGLLTVLALIVLGIALSLRIVNEEQPTVKHRSMIERERNQMM